MTDFRGINSANHQLEMPTEFTLAQLLVMALIEVKKNTDKINLYAKITNLPQMDMPEVTFSFRGSTAGVAWTRHKRTGKPTVELNEGLMRANPKHFIEDTIPHEVAHIGANVMFKRNCKHQKEWFFVMGQVLGCKPSVYHRLDVEEGKDVMRNLCRKG